MSDKQPAELEYVVVLTGGKEVTIPRWSFYLRDIGYQAFLTALRMDSEGNHVGAAQMMRQIVHDTLDTTEEQLEELCAGDLGNYEAIRDAIREHEVKPLLEQYKAKQEEGDDSPPDEKGDDTTN